MGNCKEKIDIGKSGPGKLMKHLDGDFIHLWKD